MSKNNELNEASLQDEAQWQEMEAEVSARYPQEAAALNALFASRRRNLEKAQKVEAEGLPLSTFALLLKTWLLQMQINKILRKLVAVEIEA